MILLTSSPILSFVSFFYLSIVINYLSPRLIAKIAILYFTFKKNLFISYICSLSLILTHAIIFSVAFILFNILSVCNDISFLLFRSLFYVGISQISFDNQREPFVISKAQFSSTPLYGKYNCLYIYNFTSLVLYCIHSLYCITFPLQLIRLRCIFSTHRSHVPLHYPAL